MFTVYTKRDDRIFKNQLFLSAMEPRCICQTLQDKFQLDHRPHNHHLIATFEFLKSLRDTIVLTCHNRGIWRLVLHRQCCLGFVVSQWSKVVCFGFEPRSSWSLLRLAQNGKVGIEQKFYTNHKTQIRIQLKDHKQAVRRIYRPQSLSDSEPIKLENEYES